MMKVTRVHTDFLHYALLYLVKKESPSTAYLKHYLARNESQAFCPVTSTETDYRFSLGKNQRNAVVPVKLSEASSSETASATPPRRVHELSPSVARRSLLSRIVPTLIRGMKHSFGWTGNGHTHHYGTRPQPLSFSSWSVVENNTRPRKE